LGSNALSNFPLGTTKVSSAASTLAQASSTEST
jgi:hypothetical protein